MHLQEGFSEGRIVDAAIIRWDKKLMVAEAGLHEHIEVRKSHLLNVPIKKPEDIVKAIILSLLKAGYQGPEVSAYPMLAIP